MATTSSQRKRKRSKPNRYLMQWKHRILALLQQPGGWITLVIATLLVLTAVSWIVFVLIWCFQHVQCYSREAGVVWLEGPAHQMHRPCPTVDYSTLDATTTTKNHRICITTLTDEQSPSWQQRWLRCRDFDQVGRTTWSNRKAYADKHGYTLVDYSAHIDTSRPPAWSKIKAVQSLLNNTTTTTHGCDWIFWMDADTVIMNSSIRLESFLPSDDQDVDLLVTWDRRFVANSGAWLLRVDSEWSRTFLDVWWNMRTWVRPAGYSLSGDNAAFGHVVQQTWESVNASRIRRVPRCTFNSFGVYLPQGTMPEREAGDEWLKAQEWYMSPNYYHQGDFVGHASGIDQKSVGVQMLLKRAQ